MNTWSMSAARRKLIVRAVLYIWLAWIFCVWYAMVYFGTHRPTNPIPAEGRIYPLDDHGTIVYLTWRESVLTQDLWMFYIGLGLVIGLVAKNRGWDRD